MAVGDEFPMPGGIIFRVEILEPEQTLAFASSDYKWVWSFRARTTGAGTRLISRNRIDTSDYKPKQWLGYSIMEPGSWVMERKMLLTIKELAEKLALTWLMTDAAEHAPAAVHVIRAGATPVPDHAPGAAQVPARTQP